MRVCSLLFFSALAALCGCRPPLYPSHASWTARGEDAASRFGYRACFAGDINGDGYSDFIIGAPGFDHARGKAYVYFGGPQGLPAQASWTFSGEDLGDAAGDRVGSAGDVNGDGYGDVYVAASSWKKGLGKLYVFYGGPQGLAARPSWVTQGEGVPPLAFGDCTVPTGDLNGDGFDDLAVGAYGFHGTRGEVFLFYGSKQGLAAKPAWRAEGEAPGDQFGYGLGPAGDLDGDGYDDLVIGSKYHSEGLPQAGKLYLYRGGPTGLAAATWTALGGSQSANLGTRVYGAGDLNGDGHPDLLAGAPYANGGKGELLAYAGQADGLAAKPFLTVSAPPGRTAFGFALGPLGPLGPARTPSFFVSSRGEAAGIVDIYQLSQGKPQWLQSMTDSQKDDRFGQWCAPAGDLNGDGAPDFCISADADGPGRVDVYLASSGQAGRSADAALGYFLGRGHPARLAGR